MRALVLENIKTPLVLKKMPIPSPKEGELLIQITCCAVCRTDLHVVDGELPHPVTPIIPGHQIVGTVAALGAKVSGFAVGDRVGVPWLQGACGHCNFCKSGRENLCDAAVYTGYQVNGGFAEYCVANAAFCYSLPGTMPDEKVAPLLCGGLIGYRALHFVGDAKRVGFYGFGSSAHILTQLAVAQKREIYAFTRPGDERSQKLARDLGAVWSGSSEEKPPHPLDAAILFAPVGALVPLALKAVNKGGKVICAGIHMSPIPSFPYELLWEERSLTSVANLTRRDGKEFLPLALDIPINTYVTLYPLEEGNQALDDLRNGRILGTAVITLSGQV